MTDRTGHRLWAGMDLDDDDDRHLRSLTTERYMRYNIRLPPAARTKPDVDGLQ